MTGAWLGASRQQNGEVYAGTARAPNTRAQLRAPVNSQCDVHASSRSRGGIVPNSGGRRTPRTGPRDPQEIPRRLPGGPGRPPIRTCQVNTHLVPIR
eukprot:5412287-Pyramimonas_sp.AAC.1